MNARTAFLIALGLAIVLPYVTVALLEGGGTFGIAAVTGIFLGVIALVVISDIRESDEMQLEDT
ncbi:hypothetical protein KM295_12465 [Natronomonas sp. F2-12]|jgi:hypothetical protein|uniref:Uncharacterized protein n=1 Tax=Natronomonas aquatica TaxID=2841590 RepID=A0A9R1CUZ6_9EURY|nr:hypothetical protein [Natronomonas aquatica]MCQ4334278.1 hypothetical protein [Natronomonas aquatica]